MVSARGGVRQHWTEGGINLVCCKSKKETMYMFDPVTHSSRFQLRVLSSYWISMGYVVWYCTLPWCYLSIGILEAGIDPYLEGERHMGPGKTKTDELCSNRIVLTPNNSIQADKPHNKISHTQHYKLHKHMNTILYKFCRHFLLYVF